MDKIKTNIKERVLQIAKDKGLSYEFFFSDLGLSYSNFKGKQRNTSLQSDSIDKIKSQRSKISYSLTPEDEKLVALQKIEEQKSKLLALNNTKDKNGWGTKKECKFT